ncbi:MAG: flagellar basal-body MS-ring/collar protein FliF [Thiohalomonadaceae bacterium]
MATQLAILSQNPVTRQLGVMFGLAAAVALGIAVVLWGREPTYGVLYSGLGGKDAAAVVEQLRKDGVQYKLDEATGAIMVPAGKVHDLRLQLAGAGLPQSAGVGFNVLERKQEFGTSQFMENARYQRALEEELARTIASVNHVENARVHLALPKQSVFVRKRQEPSASVLVNLYPGRSLEKQQVAAITHLVASSIPNLEPGRVTVVDQMGRLLSSEKQSPEITAGKEQFEHTRTLEAAYVARIENILAPIVGLEGVRAEVSADVDYAVTEQTQETYNPEAPALRSEQRFEESTMGSEMQGVPGALSNQPPGAAVAPETLPAQGTPAAEGEPTRTVKRATVNYELDRTISHTRSAVGQVKRLTVAVVVDDRLVAGEDGAMVRTPRTPEEIERITALVRDAVGFNAERGDTVNVVNASFTEAQGLEPLPEPPLWKQAWLWDVVKEVFAWTIAAVVLLFALRAVIRSFGAVRPEPAPAAALAAGRGMAEDQLTLTSSTPTVHLPGPDQTYEENLNQARQMALQDPKRVAQVVRSWIAADEK